MLKRLGWFVGNVEKQRAGPEFSRVGKGDILICSDRSNKFFGNES